MDITRFFDVLYTRFLLRDFLGKAMPGGLLSFAIINYLIPTGKEILDSFFELPWYFIIPVYGWTFMVGMLIQYTGTRLSMIKIHPWNPKKGLSREERSLANTMVFFVRAKDNHFLLQQRERFVILKEMTGNFGMTFYIIAIVLIIASFLTHTRLDLNYVLMLVLLCGIGTLLLWQNRYHLNEQLLVEKYVVESETLSESENSD